MMELDVIDSNGKKTGSVSLSDQLINGKLNKAVLYQAVRSNLSAEHHGTVDTKTRAEVNRTGRKIYRQKGTGNARHSSRRSAPFVGGGRVFGPHPRDLTVRLPRKVRNLSLREALRWQLIEGKVLIVNGFPFTEIKTKKAKEFFENLQIQGGLVVLNQPAEIAEKSIRNLKGFEIVRPESLRVVDILAHPRLIFTNDSFEKIRMRYLI